MAEFPNHPTIRMHPDSLITFSEADLTNDKNHRQRVHLGETFWDLELESSAATPANRSDALLISCEAAENNRYDRTQQENKDDGCGKTRGTNTLESQEISRRLSCPMPQAGRGGVVG